MGEMYDNEISSFPASAIPGLFCWIYASSDWGG